MSDESELNEKPRMEQTLAMFAKWLQAEYDAIESNRKLMAEITGHYQDLFSGMTKHIDATITMLECARRESIKSVVTPTVPPEEHSLPDAKDAPVLMTSEAPDALAKEVRLG